VRLFLAKLLAHRFLVLLACALSYAALLAWLPLLQHAGVRLVPAHAFKLQSLRGLLGLAKVFLAWALFKVGSYAPLGLLFGLAFAASDDSARARWRGSLQAVGASLGLSFLVAALQAGRLLPSPWCLPLAWLGAGGACWLTLNLRRGPPARRLIVRKLLYAAGGLVLGSGLLLLLMLESSPHVVQRRVPSAEERHQIRQAFTGRDPRKIKRGETRELRLTEQQVDALVAWGASLLKAHTAIDFRSGGAAARVALPVPATPLWVNVSAAAQIRVEHGSVSIERPALRVGKLVAPSWLLSLAIRDLIEMLRRDPDAGAVLAALHSLRVSDQDASVVYGALRAERGLAARLVWGRQVRDELGAITLHVMGRLLAASDAAGEGRFLNGLALAFASARGRSPARSAVVENRAALLALGAVFGHSKLVRSIGERPDEATLARIERWREGALLRGRNDWVRHFSVSAALTILSAVAPSDAVGLLKEELDAAGGSGFSFADLLADRCGTALAEASTDDEERATAIRDRIVAGVGVDDVFPPVDQLPEGIAHTQLQTDYGGVQGERFRALAAEIEKRVSSLPLLKL
jgi:hypothetical protein